MKNILSLVIAILFPLLVIAQNATIIGNRAIENFKQKANFKSNFVAGIQCTLEQEAILTGIGMIGKGTGTEVKLAVYSDVNGTSHELIAFTEKAKVINGEMILKVKPVKLKAGDYWIMGVYSDEGSHVFSNDSKTDKEVFYSEMKFKIPFPASASHFESYKGHEFAYFLNMKSGMKDSASEVSVYPNPTSAVVNVTNATGKEMTVELFDFLGNRKAIEQSEESIISIDLSPMNNGNYIVLINNSISKQILKR